MKQKLLTLFAMLLCGIHGAWAVDVSGTVNASSLADNAEVVLTGNTTIYMDVAKTIKSLQADYPLTISGDKVLSVINEDGNAIFADGDINISGGNIYIEFFYSAVRSYKGDITLYCNLTAEKDLAGNENIIVADMGNITTNGSIVLRNGRIGLNARKNILIEGGSFNADVENRALLAQTGTITISGDVTVKAGYNAIEAYGDIIINDVTISGSAGYNGNFIYSEIGNISTRGTITVDRGRIGLNARKNILIEGGSINVDVSNRALIAQTGTITISGDVTAKAGYNAIEAYGDIIINGATVSATTSGDNVKAIISESGNVVLTHADIVTPENGSVSGGTIIDSNGDPAKSIYIISYPLEIYTVFDSYTNTLMYFYDYLRESRSGTKELYDPSAVRFADYYNKVQKAVIDESMQNAPLTSMEKMFYGGFSMKPLYLSKMTSIEGLENLNTSEVTSMQSMFEGCQSLTELDLSTFNTANVTNTNCMFQSCTNLETLNIALFNIGKMEDMRYMFVGCSKLKTIYCNSDWSGSEVQSDYMFSGCSKLVGGQGTTYNNSKIDKSYARPDDLDNDKPGYFTVVESVAVTIGATEWATFVAPYALDFSAVDGLTAYIITGHTGSTVETVEVSDVPANTPVLLNGSADTYTIPVIGGSATDVSSNKLVAGTGAAVEAEAGKTKYVLSASDGKAVFKKINTTPATVAWGKAYLMFDGEVEARMLSFDNETGIEELKDEKAEELKSDKVIYNLAGQRVAKPVRGLYILNGKKYLMK